MLKPTTDNNNGNYHVPEENLDDLERIGNHDLKYLYEQNRDLLVFPQSLGQHGDNINKSMVFSLQGNILRTNNIMGFVGRNETQLTISSRFAGTDENRDHGDYFLHYMLQKVFAINLFRFDQTTNNESIWDFLLYLFPYYLKKAYSQGLYKAYKKEEYNDANVKGVIDIRRHIRFNIPFSGKIAYTTREHSYDNNLTQLIRHTIEYIKLNPFGCGILTSDAEIRDIISKFSFVTQNSYDKNNRNKIITANLKPVSHPYYTEYRILQKICLQILKRKKITFGARKDKIYGLLFDGAWLWEEYLGKILCKKYWHPQNITKTRRNFLFIDEKNKERQEIYPDFISKSDPKIIADAKYKFLNENEYGKDYGRDDFFQILAYMFRYTSEKGYLLFPYNSDGIFAEKLRIKNNTRSVLTLLGLPIPQNSPDFNSFKNEIQKSELNFINMMI